MSTTSVAVAPSATAAAGSERSTTRPPRRRPSTRKRLELAFLLLPSTVLFVAFVFLPLIAAVYYSLFDWSGFGPLTDFVGLDNYTQALTDPTFQAAIGHNLFIVFASLIVQLPLSIALALLLHGRIRGRTVLRLLVFTPYVLSEAVTAVIWLSLLQPNGAVDGLMQGVGLGNLIQLWLGDGNVVMFTLFAVITWKYIGFGIILFLAGLQGVPEELREAAAIDGASGWQITRMIVIPLLGPTIRIWAFLSIIGSLQLFDIVWIMTLGGPAGSSTTMASYLIDRGFRRYEFGYGSAVAIILFIFCFVFALVYQRFALRRDTQGALTGRVE
jgi:raffinose/stachyose/melibiose transport system permease protein